MVGEDSQCQRDIGRLGGDETGFGVGRAECSDDRLYDMMKMWEESMRGHCTLWRITDGWASLIEILEFVE